MAMAPLINGYLILPCFWKKYLMNSTTDFCNLKEKLKVALFLFLFAFVTNIYAVEPLPSNLINFNSQQGLNLFKKDLNVDSLKLLEHFTTQKTVTYCGVASVVMILNSTGITAPEDSQHQPYHYFNQDDFFTDQIKEIITPEEVLDHGIKLSLLNQIIQTYGLKTKLFYANNLTMENFRAVLKTAISDHQFII